MKISVQGKQVDVGESLSEYIENTLKTRTAKYFDNALDGTVTISKEKHQFKADISVHVGKEIRVQGRATAGDPYQVVDEAIERIGKQLRRYKRRLTDHNRTIDKVETESAPYYIFSSEEGGEAEDAGPAIIAEVDTNIMKLAVADAVMRMDLADLPVLMFRNSANNQLNVVYRRKDGNIGWIDPSVS